MSTPIETNDPGAVRCEDGLAVEREAAVLALMLHYEFREEAPGHCHNVRGQWDDSGLPCGRCKAWSILRAWAISTRQRMETDDTANRELPGKTSV